MVWADRLAKANKIARILDMWAYTDYPPGSGLIGLKPENYWSVRSEGHGQD